MCFYHILHKNSMGHLLRTSTGFFWPPIKVLEKNVQYFIIFLCTFSSSICCVCRTLTKIWPKNIDFYLYSYKVGERAVQRAVFALPLFTLRIDRCN